MGSAPLTSVAVICTTAEFNVSGVVENLFGSGLVLQNGGAKVPVSAGGPYGFTFAVDSGAAYDISVASQPNQPSQSCTVANGSGTVGEIP
jgi:hypothetical protein